MRAERTAINNSCHSGTRSKPIGVKLVGVTEKLDQKFTYSLQVELAAIFSAHRAVF